MHIMKPQKNSFAHLTFNGAAGEVTGANFLLEIDGKNILVDCGAHQGTVAEEDKNFVPFAYDPKSIDMLFVTHAHEDHIGRIPKLIHDGFRGIIYSTAPTRDISKLSFDDALGLMQDDAEKRGAKMMYDQGDIDQAGKLWKVVPYHDAVQVTSDLTVTGYDAGHVLGSCMWEFALTKNGVTKRMLFTGDLGNTPTTLLKDTEVSETPNFLLMESVYGDRNHEPEDRRTHLMNVIQDTAKNHGTLMIPSFSLERTQEILFDLDQLVREARIPRLPIFLDSPLAIAITEIYKKYPDYLNKQARLLSQEGDPLFTFPGLTVANTRDESMAINTAPDPKIVIAGSGMMNGGRILHHAEHHLGESRATLLLVGYQAVGTLGHLIQNGAQSVMIHDREIPVRCRVETISGYSGHKGSDQLTAFVDSIKKNIEEVFVTMGEPKSAMFLAQRLRDQVGVHAVTPNEGDRTELFF
jgi:metallo-beta-lactamase family protein